MYRSLGRLIAYATMGSIFIGLFLIILGAAGNPKLILWGLCLVAAPILVVIVMSKVSGKSKRAIAEKEEWERSISVSDDGSITIRRRAPIISKNIGFEEFKYTQKEYQKAELIYTGATYGGVHMGGIHEIPEEQTEGSIIHSGRYDLVMGVNTVIDKITLTDEALNDAKQNPFISNFLKGKTLILRHDIPKTDTEFSQRWKIAFAANPSLESATAMSNFDNKLKAKTKLTYDECVKVRNWLGGQ